MVIGGGGLIGSHTVEALVKEDVGEIVIYDNFVRGSQENLRNALKDPRVKIYDVGGDILQSDILEAGARRRRWRIPLRRSMAFAVSRVSAQRLRRQRARHVQRHGRVRQEERQAAGLLVLGLGLRRCRRRADGLRIIRSTTRTSMARPRYAARRCCAPITTATVSTTWGCAT